MSKPVTQSVRYVTVEVEYIDQRLDNFLLNFLRNVPRTRVYRLLRKGEVRVNKKRADPSYRLQLNDQIRIPPVYQAEKPPPLRPSDSLLALLKDRILFESADVLIVNKPAGIPVHGGTGLKMGMIDALRHLFPHLKHLELAHRLDRETSGCLLLAKKRSILKELHGLFREGKITKKYLALTRGHWDTDELSVDVPLLKNQLASGARIVRVDSAGKAAKTIFKIQHIFQKATLVEAQLYTGRTHQIRVHAAYRHHPIACDEKYGDRNFDREIKKTGLNRLFLHAHQLEFSLVSSTETISVTAPLDADLEACLAHL